MKRIAFSGLRTFIKRRFVLQGAQPEKSVKTKSWWLGTESNRRRRAFSERCGRLFGGALPRTPRAQPKKLLARVKWWPGTESNRRRQPFQGCALPTELPGHAHAKKWVGFAAKAARTGACRTASIIAKPAGLPQMRWVSLVATVLDCFLRSS